MCFIFFQLFVTCDTFFLKIFHFFQEKNSLSFRGKMYHMLQKVPFFLFLFINTHFHLFFFFEMIIINIFSGTFSKVFLGLSIITHERVAIKVVKKVGDLKTQQMIKNESAILLQMDHPYIIKCYDLFENEDSLYIVMELYVHFFHSCIYNLQFIHSYVNN
jgi:hypothetical protein